MTAPLRRVVKERVRESIPAWTIDVTKTLECGHKYKLRLYDVTPEDWISEKGLLVPCSECAPEYTIQPTRVARMTDFMGNEIPVFVEDDDHE